MRLRDLDPRSPSYRVPAVYFGIGVLAVLIGIFASILGGLWNLITILAFPVVVVCVLGGAAWVWYGWWQMIRGIIRGTRNQD